MSAEMPIDELILTKFEEVKDLLQSYENYEENICRLKTEIDSLLKNIKDKENTIKEINKHKDDLKILIFHKKTRNYRVVKKNINYEKKYYYQKY